MTSCSCSDSTHTNEGRRTQRPRISRRTRTAGHHDNLNATGVYRATGLNFGLSTDDPAAYFANVTMPQVDAPSGHCPRDPSSALQPYS